MDDLGPDGFPLGCPESLPLESTATAPLTFDVDLSIDGGPLVFGESNPLAAGGTVLPTNLRFYLSQFQLLQDGESTHARLVDGGTPLAYGAHLVNAEDASTLQFSAVAPPGQYEGLSFIVGLSYGCNLEFNPLKPPLDDASQMKWPHTLGFLFLRFEGNLSEDVGEDTPDKIHMGAAAGYDGMAPRFVHDVPITVSPEGVEIRLQMDFDTLLEAAATPTDLSDFELPPPSPPFIEEEILAGERLRRHAPSSDLFAVSISP